MFYFYFLCLTHYSMLLLDVYDTKCKINNNEITKSEWEIWEDLFQGDFLQLKIC